MGFVQFKEFFTITETSIICKFTKSGFADLSFIFLADCYFGQVNLCCVILRAKCIHIGLCGLVWMGRENFINFMKCFMATVLFSAQQVWTQILSALLPLGERFPVIFKAVYERHSIQP